MSPRWSAGLVRGWVADLLAGGAAQATARTRQMSLRRFGAWLVEEELLDTDPLLGLKPPQLDTKVIEGLTAEQCAALVKACQGKRLADRRDEAITRLMIETGMRAGEVIGLQADDVDLPRGLAVVRRGKGGKGRIVPFGPQVARSIDRYLRMRRGHRLEHTGALWLGEDGQTFAYHGLNATMKRRAELAGIKGFHLPPAAPHRGLALAGRRGLGERSDGRRRVVAAGRCWTATPGPPHPTALPLRPAG